MDIVRSLELESCILTKFFLTWETAGLTPHSILLIKNKDSYRVPQEGEQKKEETIQG